MIDHISIAVRDLVEGERFYAAILAPLGLTKLREWPGAAVGFGKKYPEFWINRREGWRALPRIAACTFVCARPIPRRSMPSTPRRSSAGGTSDGEPGLRPHYYAGYYAAFVRDPDGNRIEAVTFMRDVS